MNKKCVICRNRKGCLNYQLGGLIGDWCDRFSEEAEITEEQQKQQEAKEAEKKPILGKLLGKMKKR